MSWAPEVPGQVLRVAGPYQKTDSGFLLDAGPQSARDNPAIAPKKYFKNTFDC